MRFDDLAEMTEAEEWFEALGVPYDAAALARVRIPLLKRFGAELQVIEQRIGFSDAERVKAARAALAYAFAAVLEPEPTVFRGPLVQLGRPERG